MSIRYTEDLISLERELRTNFDIGLSSAEAAKRRDAIKRDTKHKEHSLFVADKKSVFSSISPNVFTPPMIALIFISLVGALIGRSIVSAAIFAIAAVTAIIFGVIASRTQDRLDAMRNYAAPLNTVKRSGRIVSTDGRNLVPGDIILLGSGDLITCDARIISCSDFVVDELYLDDDGVKRKRVKKSLKTDDSEASDVLFADDVLYAGSAVIEGSAVAVVIEVGRNVTLAEHVSSGSFAGVDTEQKWLVRMRPFMFKITLVTTMLILILPIIGLFTLSNHTDLFGMALTMISTVLFVSNGFFTIISGAIFSQSMFRLAKNKRKTDNFDMYAAIRNYKAVDTLSNITDVVLLGSAGVLMGEYKVNRIFTASGEIRSSDAIKKSDRRLLSLICSYIYTKKTADGIVNCYTDGVTAALNNYINECRFDIEGANSIVRSRRYEIDRVSDEGFAYVETNTEFYRVALARTVEVVKYCNFIRCDSILKSIEKDDINKISEFYKDCKKQANECVFVIAEQDNRIVLEAIISFNRVVDRNLAESVKKLKELGVNTTLMLDGDDDYAESFLKDSAVPQAIWRGVLISKPFENTHITDDYAKYGAFVGYDKSAYLEIIKKMKQNGARVATYALDNKYNDIMSAADLCVTCDTIDYTLEKHRDSVYESLPTSGGDCDIRASQQTKLLSKVIVRRATERGGGLSALLTAVKASRTAYVSFAGAVSFFITLMSVLASFTVMSVLTGQILLDSLQTALLSVTFAIMSAVLYTGRERSRSSVLTTRDYTNLPLLAFKRSLSGVIARAIAVAVLSVIIKVLDSYGILGKEASISLPIFACLVLTVIIEVLAINLKAYGRINGSVGVWRKLVTLLVLPVLYFAYKLLSFLFNVAYDAKLFLLLLIIPAYLILYALSVTIASFVVKKKN